MVLHAVTSGKRRPLMTTARLSCGVGAALCGAIWLQTHREGTWLSALWSEV